MEFTYENQGTTTYLVYRVTEEDTLDTMSLGMLTNNKISGVAQTIFMQMDRDKFIKYNVSAKVSLEQYFTGVVNKTRFLAVLRGIVSALMGAEEYMLDLNTILLDRGYIFTNVSGKEIALICLPLIGGTGQPQDLRDFFRNIMFGTQFDQSENGDYLAKLINYLNNPNAFSLPGFQEILDSIAPDEKVVKPLVEPKSAPTPTPKAEQIPTPDPVVAPATVPVPDPKPVSTQASAVPQGMQIPGAPQGMQVPNVPGKQAAPAQPAPSKAGAAGEKGMSLFYLLQHYSAENAAIYKAQQEEKKAAKGAAQPEKPAQPSKAEKKKEKGKGKGTAPTPAAPGFAIPGQTAAPVPTPAPASVPQQPVAVPTPSPASTPTPTPVAAPVAPSAPVQNVFGGSADFGETSYFGSGEDDESATVIMGADPATPQALTPYLLRQSNGEKVFITKPLFRLGRDVAFNDYVILDNKFVGHSHCYVVIRDGEYFVVDAKSKNHTSVNGVIIQPEQEVKIAHGDKIDVANERFEFRLY